MAVPALPDVKLSRARPTTRPRVREVRFGDGYPLRQPDGLNHLLSEWRLTFRHIEETERDTLIAFFEARGGTEPFSWTPPGSDESRNFVCTDWRESQPEGGDIWTVEASLVEDFAP